MNKKFPASAGVPRLAFPFAAAAQEATHCGASSIILNRTKQLNQSPTIEET